MSGYDYESIVLPENFDTSAFSMEGEEEEAPYTQTITRFSGKMVGDRYVGEMAEFEVKLRGETYEGRGKLAQPSVWTSLSKREYTTSEGKKGINASGGLQQVKFDPLEVDLGKGMLPLTGVMYAMVRLQRKAEGKNEDYTFAQFQEDLKGMRINFQRGMAMFWQQRGADPNGYLRAKQLFTTPNPRRGYDPTNVYDQVAEDKRTRSTRDWRNMTENWQADRSTAMLVYGFHLGQEDPAWANPPDRKVYHDPFSAQVEEWEWWLARRKERRIVRKALESASGDEKSKLDARVKQLDSELRFFNLAGVDEIAVVPEGQTETITLPNGREVLLRVATDRFRSREAPVGQLITQVGDVILFQRPGRSTSTVPANVVTATEEEEEITDAEIVNDDDTNAEDETEPTEDDDSETPVNQEDEEPF